MHANLYGFEKGRKERGFKVMVESPDSDQRIVIYAGYDEITIWPTKDGDIDELFAAFLDCHKRWTEYKERTLYPPSHI